MIQPEEIRGNLEDIHRRIRRAAEDCGRDTQAISLVAVSKTQSTTAIAAAIAAGQFLFGENRVQEAAGKFPGLKALHRDLRLHLVGPLQTNKVREAVGLADCIQTLDREKLARALADEFQRRGRTCDLMIQVNTGLEAQKAGVPPAEADRFIDLCRRELGLTVAGLMCIPPADEHPAPHFALLREIAKRHGLAMLSMGMSADFETAIQFGATHVRVGSAIFGAREA
jgi:pyridoxal phosphate enzyme (YggS family)